MNVNIRPLRRRSRRDQLLKAAREIQLPSLSDIHAPKTVRSGATAVVAATVASAAVSALRRRIESTGGDR
jgi:predicted nicotinamide N-methyase